MNILKPWPKPGSPAGRNSTAVRWSGDALLLIAIAVVPVLPMFMGRLPGGHDLVIHLWRIAGITDGLREGMFPVRMQQIWFNRYGYPMGIMYGDALLYFPALLYLCGMPLWKAYRAYVIVISILTAWTSRRFFYAISKNRSVSCAASLLYVWSVWRLADVLTRASLGEYSAMAFLPLAAWGVYELFLKNSGKKRAIILLTAGFTGLIQTHLLSTFMAGIFLVLVCIVLIQRLFTDGRWKTLLLSFVLIAAVNAGLLLPMADYLTNVPMRISEEEKKPVQAYGVSFSQLTMKVSEANVVGGMWDDDRPESEEMPQTVGLALMGGLLAALILLSVSEIVSRRKRKPGKPHPESNADGIAGSSTGITACLFLILSVISLFMATKYMPYDWLEAHVRPLGRLLGVIQFPVRYLEFAALFICALLALSARVLAENNSAALSARVLAEKNSAARARAARLCAAGFMTALCVVSGIQCMAYISPFMQQEPPSWTSSVTDISEIEGFPDDRLYLLSGTDMERVQYASVLPEDEDFIVGEYGWDGATLLVAAERTADREGYLDLPVFAYPGYRAWAVSGTGEEDRMRFAVGTGDNNKLRVVLPADYKGTFAVRFVEPWYWRAAELLSLISMLAGIYSALSHKAGKPA